MGKDEIPDWLSGAKKELNLIAENKTTKASALKKEEEEQLLSAQRDEETLNETVKEYKRVWKRLKIDQRLEEIRAFFASEQVVPSKAEGGGHYIASPLEIESEGAVFLEMKRVLEKVWTVSGWDGESSSSYSHSNSIEFFELSLSPKGISVSGGEERYIKYLPKELGSLEEISSPEILKKSLGKYVEELVANPRPEPPKRAWGA